MAAAMELNFFEPESLFKLEEDFERTEERDHHGREEEGVGIMEMRQRRSELVKIWKEWKRNGAQFTLPGRGRGRG